MHLGEPSSSPAAWPRCKRRTVPVWRFWRRRHVAAAVSSGRAARVRHSPRGAAFTSSLRRGCVQHSATRRTLLARCSSRRGAASAERARRAAAGERRGSTGADASCGRRASTRACAAAWLTGASSVLFPVNALAYLFQLTRNAGGATGAGHLVASLARRRFDLVPRRVCCLVRHRHRSSAARAGRGQGQRSVGARGRRFETCSALGTPPTAPQVATVLRHLHVQIRAACSGVVTACREVETLSIMMQNDIKCAIPGALRRREICLQQGTLATNTLARTSLVQASGGWYHDAACHAVQSGRSAA